MNVIFVTSASTLGRGSYVEAIRWFSQTGSVRSIDRGGFSAASAVASSRERFETDLVPSDLRVVDEIPETASETALERLLSAPFSIPAPPICLPRSPTERGFGCRVDPARQKPPLPPRRLGSIWGYRNSKGALFFTLRLCEPAGIMSFSGLRSPVL